MKCLNPRWSSSRGALVPCNQCYYCRTRKKFEWVTRCLLERCSYNFGYFVTLTYNNDNLPEDKGVSYKDADYFIDELRKSFHACDFEFSYYLMSEYGGRSQRPHYHMHLFTDAPLEFVGTLLTSTWNKGFIKIGRTTLKSILYTSAFHLLPKEYIENYSKPNFHIISRGLGRNFAERYKSYYFEHGRTYFDYGGRSFGLPPYIRKKMGLVELKELRDLNLNQVRDEFYLNMVSKGIHSEIWKHWEKFCNNLNNKLIKNGLKSKI